MPAIFECEIARFLAHSALRRRAEEENIFRSIIAPDDSCALHISIRRADADARTSLLLLAISYVKFRLATCMRADLLATRQTPNFMRVYQFIISPRRLHRPNIIS